MQYIADLQIHSKYARAVSQEMVLPKIWDWAKRKGIDLVATGDWTHPLWMGEIKSQLEEEGDGILRLKKLPTPQIENNLLNPKFLLATEVSCIYSQGGKLRRIHTLVWVSTIAVAEKINAELLKQGANLMSDGRPIVGLSSVELAELVLTVDTHALIIPAHSWTPWFSLYGSESGFDSLDEAFGDYSKYIYAIETGLSSDPAMNWRIKELDSRSIVSFSDAHSGPKLGREVTVFEMPELTYFNIFTALSAPYKKDALSRIAYSVEFYPEEGKYHYTGHRKCSVKQTPSETREKGTMCPICGRKLTVGVMHRVDQLAERNEEELRIKKCDIRGTQLKGFFSELFPYRPPYVKMVPLFEILSESLGKATTTMSVKNEYAKLIDNLGGETSILMSHPISEIQRISGSKIADAIYKVREGSIFIDPGYDSVFGTVKIWGERAQEDLDSKKQLSLF